MSELLKRFKSRPYITAELFLASFIISILVLSTSIFVIQVLNRYVSHGVTATLITLCIGVLIAIGMEFLFRQIRLKLISEINLKCELELQKSTYDKLVGARNTAIERVPQNMLHEMMNGLNIIQQTYSPANIATVLDAFFAVLYVFALFMLLPVLGYLAIGFILVLFFVIGMGQARRKESQHKLNKIQSALTGLTNSAIQSSDGLRTFTVANFLAGKWQQAQLQASTLRLKLSRNSSLTQSLTQTITSLMSVSVITIGAIYVVQGDLSIGTMIGANILGSRALAPFSRLAQLGDGFARAREAIAVLERFHKIPQEKSSGTQLEKLFGNLKIKNLSYSFPQSRTPIFEDVDFTLPHGKLLVVKGDNDAGKTTLIRLMLGLLEPQRGTISIDGVDLQQLDIKWWRNQVSYVPQEPEFFNASVYNNLTFGLEKVTMDSVNLAAKKAHLVKWLKGSSDGLNTQLQNGGANLPVGIRRRLALARALLRGGQFMILEEPLIGLDTKGISAVMASLKEFAQKGSTVIVCTSNPRLLKGQGHTLEFGQDPTPVFSLPVKRNTLPQVGQA
jgi:ATP-binding cassette, subfamily C, bacterial LapB